MVLVALGLSASRLSSHSIEQQVLEAFSPASSMFVVIEKFDCSACCPRSLNFVSVLVSQLSISVRLV